MAQDYSIKFTGDSSELTKALNDAKDKFDKITTSTAPLKRRLAEVKKLMAEMNLKGLSNTDVFAQMAEEAGTYADAIGDAQTAVAAFANDNMKLEAMAQGFQLITGSAAALTGALGMLGVENEKVEQAMLQVQSAISLVNGVTAIANVLNKDSALMLRLKQIRLLANTAAQKANTVATVTDNAATSANTTTGIANTAATTANTVATAANTAGTVAATSAKNALNWTVAVGKALFGDFTGLVLLGAAALTTYAIATGGADKAQQNANNTVVYSKTVVKEYSDELASVIKNSVSRVKSLSAEFKVLQTEADKTEWIKNNRFELEKLGATVSDLINLDEEFKNKNSELISTLENRAKTLVTLKNAHRKYIDETAQKSGDLVSKFQSLKIEWDRLKTAQEKTDWIKANNTEFSNLGLSISDLVDAENVFTNNTSKVVKALELRAQAAAAQSAITDAYKKYYEDKKENQSTTIKTVKAGQQINKKDIPEFLKKAGSVNAEGHVVNDDYFTVDHTRNLYKLTEKGAKAMNKINADEARAQLKSNIKEAEQTLNKTTEFYTKEIDKKVQEVEKLGLGKVVKNPLDDSKSTTETKTTKTGPGTKTEKIDYLVSVDDGSLDTAEKKLSAWQSKLKVTPTTDEAGIERCNQEIENWKKEVEKRKLIIEGKIAEGSKADLENQLKKLEEQKKLLFKTNADPETVKRLEEEIKALKKKLEEEEIRLGIKPEIEAGSIADIRKKIKEKEDEINLALNTDFDADSMKRLQAELEKLRKEEQEKSIKIGVVKNVATISKNSESWERGSVQDKRESLSTAQSMVQEIQENYHLKLIGKDEVQSQLAEINSQLESLGLKPITLSFNNDGTLTTAAEDLENYQKKMGAVSDMVGDMGSAFGSLGSAIGGTTGSIMQFAGQSINAIAQLVPQIVTLITAKQAESTASLVSGASQMQPWPAAIAAVAASVATIASIFASLPKFESGGIVPGSSFRGDNIIARLNSGEGVLTRKGITNLYNTVNNAQIGSPAVTNTLRGEVDFKISGSSLHGALKNYNSKMTRIK